MVIASSRPGPAEAVRPWLDHFSVKMQENGFQSTYFFEIFQGEQSPDPLEQAYITAGTLLLCFRRVCRQQVLTPRGRQAKPCPNIKHLLGVGKMI